MSGVVGCVRVSSREALRGRRTTNASSCEDTLEIAPRSSLGNFYLYMYKFEAVSTRCKSFKKLTSMLQVFFRSQLMLCTPGYWTAIPPS